MDTSVLSPAILAICLDLRSLSYKADQSWAEDARDPLPRSLAERMTWNADVATGGSRSRSRSKSRPASAAGRFADAGLNIMQAESATDALALLRVLRFDLGLIGADTLGMSVPSLLRQIQIVSPGTRCIVVSSTMDQPSERSIREAGVLAILDAPLPVDQLRDVVSHLALCH